LLIYFHIYTYTHTHVHIYSSGFEKYGLPTPTHTPEELWAAFKTNMDYARTRTEVGVVWCSV
jgi:hypothetical protein